MQPISNTFTEPRLRLLLQGDPKSGKTAMACQFPGAYVIDVDVNLEGPIRWLQSQKLKLPVGFDVLDKDESGRDLPVIARYQRFIKLMDDAYNNPIVQTIIIDSATSFADVLMEETKRLQPSVKDGRQIYNFFFMYGKAMMDKFKACRKHIVFIAHERADKREDGSIVMPYRVSWPGQMSQIMASFFTDVWRTEVEQKPTQPPTYEWMIRTMPNHAYKLGNSLGLPPVFKFDWSLIQAKLDAMKTQTA